MEKFERTKVNRLQIGDRFHKVSDTTKKVYEMVQGDIRRTKYRTYGFFCKADNSTMVIPINGTTEVVFLRHNENAEQPTAHPPQNRKRLGAAFNRVSVNND